MKTGTLLKQFLAKTYILPLKDCNCLQYIRLMNNRGNRWCEEHPEEILEWLKASAKKAKIPFPETLIPLLKPLILKAVEKEKMSLIDTFEEVYCVNLDRREDRWKEFQEGLPEDWPFREVIRSSAIDGKKVKHPEHWTQGGGAWGCYRSHLRIIEDCLNRGVKSVLLLEDDARFLENFTGNVKSFLNEVPGNWCMIYLGGQHLYTKKTPPLQVSEQIYIPYNVNRTHAFALQMPGMLEVYKHLHKSDWISGHHIDHHLGRFHQNRDKKFPVFCPREWLVGQRESLSNINGRENPERFWEPAEKLAEYDPRQQPFVSVVGLHSSGSSALTGVLYHLGVHLGNQLGGYYGNNPEQSCGFEAIGLAQLCESSAPFPQASFTWKKARIYNRLKGWIYQRQGEAFNLGTIAGGKYPHFCRMGNPLLSICGDRLKVIHSSRPLEDSIQSLQKRCANRNPEDIRNVQNWLWNGKQEFFSKLKPLQKLDVDYYSLLEHPEKEVSHIIKFLELEPTPEQIAKAVSSIKPEKRHI